MDLVISAVTGDLANRLVSFLMNKYTDHASSEEKVERLQQLLLRVCMVIEEADSRYITNSCMLIQLKMLAAAMYQGHHVLDTVKYRKHKEFFEESIGVTECSAKPRGRCCQYGGVCRAFGRMRRISRRPYDTYLYIDNFMFGRHVEKQQIIGFLLQHDSPGPPAVLPVIGGNGVGKKTLVAHVCDNERVRSHFPMILHLKGDDFLKKTGRERLSGKTLVVIEFVSDVDDDDWATFYHSIRKMDTGSKVVILGRNTDLGKFGTVKTIFLSCLPLQEYSYLFKTLAFGSANPRDYPRLASMVEEFSKVLGGSLISANLLADALRKNLSACFWLDRLNMVRGTVSKNISRFGAHPQELFSRGHPVHLIGGYILSPAIPSSVFESGNGMASVPEENLPRIMFGDLIAAADHTVLPRGHFRLISWESRLPPYTSFVHLVRSAPSCADDKPEPPLSGKKRAGLFT